MGLWGKSTSAESRPKFLSTDNNATGAGGARNNAFANTSGWALRPGLAMSGNDNSSAQAEVLVCIRNLSSTMAEANLLSVGWDSNTSLAHDGSGYIDIYFNCDEAITVTSATYTGDSTETNHWHFTLRALDPDDLSEDFLDFETGIEATAYLFPSINVGEGITQNPIGSAMFISPRLMRGMLSQVYILNDPFNNFPNFELIHSEPSLIIDSLRAQGMDLPDFVYYQGTQGPIKIWEITYTGEEELQEKYIDRDSSKYLSWKL